MNAQTPIAARRSAKWHDSLSDRIEAAFNDANFEETEAFRMLAELSQSTEIVGHSLDIDSTVTDGDVWTTPGTVFVTLRYDVNSNEPVEIDDAYPITVRFRLRDDDVTIDSVAADTSSFYE